MLRSETITDLAPALVAAQAAITPAEKDGTNPHFKTRYASLGAVMAAIRPALAANGLAVSQIVTRDGDALALETILVHASGQYIGGTYPLRPTKADPQGEGSALTYARRYALASLLGVVADDDDDGNAASRQPERRPRPAVVAPGGARIAPERRNAPQATGYTPNAAQQPASDDFDALPSASTAPAQAAALAHGTNGNGHLPARPSWKGPDDAQAWAMRQCDAAGQPVFHARPHVVNSYNKARERYVADNGANATPGGFFDTWYAHVQVKIAEANAALSAELDAQAAADERAPF